MNKVRIVVDTESCIFGWGPCEGKWSHTCKKLTDHEGNHVCLICGATRRADSTHQ